MMAYSNGAAPSRDCQNRRSPSGHCRMLVSQVEADPQQPRLVGPGCKRADGARLR
jgi:hypothetical protein